MAKIIRTLPLFILLLALNGHAQSEDEIFFSVAIEKNIKKFNHRSEAAFLNNDMQRVDFLFDSLVNHVIKGTYLDNFAFNKTNGKKVQLEKFKKPLFIITYSSWYPLGDGEIQAFNRVAQEFSKEIDFIALFWEPMAKTKEISRGFSRKVRVMYVDEMGNKSDRVVRSMKHSLGVPTAFFTDRNRQILDVGRLPAHYFKNGDEASFEAKYSYFIEGVNTIRQASMYSSD